MNEPIITIKNLRKKYRLGTIGGRTLQADLQSWWAKKKHRPDPNLKISDEGKSLGTEFIALDGINLEIYKGEALGIIGANGAGKSTLLKILSRVTAPTEGDIWVNGRIASMLEVGTGFHGELTGRENIYMNGAILGMTKKEVNSKIESIIDFSECRPFIDTPVKRYSSGMYVKLAFAVASHLDSEILIMDEVLAVGDMAFQKKSLSKMGDIASSERRTILYVSHNMSTIRRLCSRCMVLDHGKLVFCGDVEQAIGVYMNVSISELKTFYSFVGQTRATKNRGTIIEMCSLEFINTPTARFYSSTPILFYLTVHAHRPLNNIRFRIEVRTPDGSNVGMSESSPLFDINEDEKKKLLFSFDPSNLSEGIYLLRTTIFQLLDSGVHEGLDESTEPIYIEIIEDNLDRSRWMPQFWGRIKLPPVQKVLECKI